MSSQQVMSQQNTGSTGTPAQNSMISSPHGNALGMGNEGTPGLQGNQSTPGNVPLSLADLQNPQTFNLGGPSTPPNKRRVTKASFDNQSGSLVQKTNEEELDPLSMLDPLWTMKK